MRQLDLFGFLPDTHFEEVKTEAIHSILESDDACDVAVNKSISYSSIEIASKMQEEKAVENADIFKMCEKNSETVEYIASFTVNTALEEFSPLLNVANSTVELPVFEVDMETEQKETKSTLFSENEETRFKDKKITVKEKDIKPAIKQEQQKRGRKSLAEIEAEFDLIEVPDDEVLFKKQYYSISEVAKWFRVNTSLLRFWEKEFDILTPKKNGKGDRFFRPEDVKNLQLIYQLLRLRKYTIEGAKEYIKTHKTKGDNELELANTLQKFKSFLLDLKANLQ